MGLVPKVWNMAHGPMGSWAQGAMGPWAHGLMGPWAQWHMGPCARKTMGPIGPMGFIWGCPWPLTAGGTLLNCTGHVVSLAHFMAQAVFFRWTVFVVGKQGLSPSIDRAHDKRMFCTQSLG